MFLMDNFTNPGARTGSMRAASHLMLTLAFGFTFPDLYDRDALVRLDGTFLDFVGKADAPLRDQLVAARRDPATLPAKQESGLLLAVAPWLEDFIARLFVIEEEVRVLAARHHALAPIYSVKRLFVQRKAMHKFKSAEAGAFDGAQLEAELERLLGEPFSELAFARGVTQWQQDEAAHAAELDVALRYAAWSAHTAAGHERHRHGVLFKAPAKLDPLHLVPVVTEEREGYSALRLADGHLRRRQGFKLT